jgi:hypothetical protein
MTFKPHHDPAHLYFITATVLGWKKLFNEPAYARIALDSLAWHRQHTLRLCPHAQPSARHNKIQGRADHIWRVAVLWLVHGARNPCPLEERGPG